jgi:hypothetical protein
MAKREPQKGTREEMQRLTASVAGKLRPRPWTAEQRARQAEAAERERIADEAAKREVAALLAAVDAEELAKKRAKARRKALQSVGLGGEPRPAPISFDTGESAVEVRSLGSIHVGSDHPYQPGGRSLLRDVYRFMTRFQRVPFSGQSREDSNDEIGRRLLQGLRRQIFEEATKHPDPEVRALRRRVFFEKFRTRFGTSGYTPEAEWQEFLRTGGHPMSESELRAVSTSTASMGDFDIPAYLLLNYAGWNTAAKPGASALRQVPAPSFGVQLNVPVFGSAVSASVQDGENTAFTLSSPDADYATVNLSTVVSGVLLSEQLFARSPINVDTVLTANAGRSAGTTEEGLALTAILGGAQTITDTATSPGIQYLLADVADAKKLIRTYEGTRLVPSHTLMPTALLDYYQSLLGSDGHPIFPPTPAGVGGREGQFGTDQEGYAGFDLVGTRLFGDDSSELVSDSDATVVVGDFPNGGLWIESEPVAEVITQYSPTSLTVLFRWRKYVAPVVLYPNGFVAISSSTGAYPSDPDYGA